MPTTSEIETKNRIEAWYKSTAFRLISQSTQPEGRQQACINLHESCSDASLKALCLPSMDALFKRMREAHLIDSNVGLTYTNSYMHKREREGYVYKVLSPFYKFEDMPPSMSVATKLCSLAHAEEKAILDLWKNTLTLLKGVAKDITPIHLAQGMTFGEIQNKLKSAQEAADRLIQEKQVAGELLLQAQQKILQIQQSNAAIIEDAVNKQLERDRKKMLDENRKKLEEVEAERIKLLSDKEAERAKALKEVEAERKKLLEDIRKKAEDAEKERKKALDDIRQKKENDEAEWKEKCKKDAERVSQKLKEAHDKVKEQQQQAEAKEKAAKDEIEAKKNELEEREKLVKEKEKQMKEYDESKKRNLPEDFSRDVTEAYKKPKSDDPDVLLLSEKISNKCKSEKTGQWNKNCNLLAKGYALCLSEREYLKLVYQKYPNEIKLEENCIDELFNELSN